MSHTDYLSSGSHGRVIRSPSSSERYVGESRVKCETCQQDYRFFSAPLRAVSATGERTLIQGVAQRSCGCGASVVPIVRPEAIQTPREPLLRTPHSRPRTEQRCPCGTIYTTFCHDPKELCPKCRGLASYHRRRALKAPKQDPNRRTA